MPARPGHDERMSSPTSPADPRTGPWRGVHPIVPTAFHSGGSFDEASQRRLVDHLVATGAHGVAILGFLGEAHKLSSQERRHVIRAVTDHGAGRLKVLVGVRTLGTAGAIEQAAEAKELGADAVFAAPIGVQNDAVLFDYYRDLAQGSGIPVMIHDYPDSFGVTISSDLVIRLAREVPGIIGVKAEDPPVLVKLSAILAGAPHLAVHGGLGGVYFIEELQRGAAGIMTGFSFPEALLDIYQRFTSGDTAGATKTFDRYATLLRYEFQPKLGLAFRKHVYLRKGIFESDFIRSPGMKLDEVSRREYEALVARVGLSM